CSSTVGSAPIAAASAAWSCDTATAWPPPTRSSRSARSITPGELKRTPTAAFAGGAAAHSPAVAIVTARHSVWLVRIDSTPGEFARMLFEPVGEDVVVGEREALARFRRVARRIGRGREQIAGLRDCGIRCDLQVRPRHQERAAVGVQEEEAGV